MYSLGGGSGDCVRRLPLSLSWRSSLNGHYPFGNTHLREVGLIFVAVSDLWHATHTLISFAASRSQSSSCSFDFAFESLAG